MKASDQLALTLNNIANKIDRLTNLDRKTATAPDPQQLSALQYAEWLAQFLREEADRLTE